MADEHDMKDDERDAGLGEHDASTDELDPSDKPSNKPPQMYYCWHCGHQTYESRWQQGWCTSCGSAMPPRKWITSSSGPTNGVK